MSAGHTGSRAGTLRQLECAVCAGDAGRHHQHWNRDTGYGICRKCVDRLLTRGTSAEEMRDLYGIEGVNYASATPTDDRSRVTATILAALRYWQREGLISAGHEQGIASDCGRLQPLSAVEIDALCEEIICSANDPASKMATQGKTVTEMVHREIDELMKLKVFTPERARTLKDRLTTSVIERHVRDGMTTRDMIDMYNDLADPQ